MAKAKGPYRQSEVGQLVQVYGVWCRVETVRPFGTVDVEAVDGSGRWWRVSGLVNRGN